MTDDSLRRAYASGLRRGEDRSGCVPAEAIEALVTRSGSEADRLATLDHVMACAACRADFDLMQAFTGEKKAVARINVPLVAAASVGLVLAGSVLVMAINRREPEQTLRGEDAAFELVAPAGDGVRQPVAFTWHGVPGARRYILEVFNASGDAVYTIDVADTTVTMPDSVTLVAGETHHWWLVVRRSDGTESRSQPQSFTP